MSCASISSAMPASLTLRPKRPDVRQEQRARQLLRQRAAALDAVRRARTSRTTARAEADRIDAGMVVEAAVFDRRRRRAADRARSRRAGRRAAARRAGTTAGRRRRRTSCRRRRASADAPPRRSATATTPTAAADDQRARPAPTAIQSQSRRGRTDFMARSSSSQQLRGRLLGSRLRAARLDARVRIQPAPKDHAR